MSGKILGIDINEDFIAAVQIVSGLKGFQVSSCASIMIAKDSSPAEALEALSQKIELKDSTCIASINAASVSFQNLVMPFKDPKKIKQILPFEMETLVPFPIEDIVIDFNIVKSADQSEILAVSAKKALISEYLGTLKPFGISPNLIDIGPVPIALWLLAQTEAPHNGLVIDIGLKRINIVLFLEKRIALIRSMPLAGGINTESISKAGAPSKEDIEVISGELGVFVKNTLRAFFLQIKRNLIPEKIFITGIGSQYPGIADIIRDQSGISVEMIDISKDKRVRLDYAIETKWNPAFMDGALSNALREIKKGHGFNLRKGEFEIRQNLLKTVKKFRKLGIAVLVILVLLMIDFGTDYFLVKKKYDAAAQQCVELFRQSFPESQNVKYPLLEMKLKIDALKKSASSLPGSINNEEKMLDLINDISQRIPKEIDIDVSSLRIDNEAVTVTGKTDSYNTVNNLEGELKASRYFSDVEITRDEQDKTGKKVEFELKLQRK